MRTNDIHSVVESTIEELTEKTENLRDKAETTLNHAHAINEREVNSSEHYVPLDDQPYGEELIRTKGMLESLEKQLEELEEIRDEEELSIAVKKLQDSEEVINEHSDTFDDCFNQSFVDEANKSSD